MRCLNVSFTHHKFPYRLEHGKGTLELKDDLLKLNLTAYSGSQPVRLAAEVAHPFSGPTGWFEAKGDDIQLDEALLAALPEKPQEVVRSLDPARHGQLLRADVARPAGRADAPAPAVGGRTTARSATTSSPIRLANIRGTLEMFDGDWTFRNLEGSNDKARVTCDGTSDARPRRATSWC